MKEKIVKAIQTIAILAIAFGIMEVVGIVTSPVHKYKHIFIECPKCTYLIDAYVESEGKYLTISCEENEFVCKDCIDSCETFDYEGWLFNSGEILAEHIYKEYSGDEAEKIFDIVSDALYDAAPEYNNYVHIE